MKIKGYAKFAGGGGGANKVHYGRCTSGDLLLKNFLVALAVVVV